MQPIGRNVWHIGGLSIWRFHDGYGTWHEVRLLGRAIYQADFFTDCRRYIQLLKAVTF